ncbi:PAS domain-containing sensor histidine kinase [Pleionea sediminis]|uniref:PAS domain-containing sensor histidine kinase n=1 Tax=Pleionea sediminis TaxID=2569479 RepID=UPI0013DE228F|nr:ATP-binding protein [Pleionea sediminis]
MLLKLSLVHWILVISLLLLLSPIVVDWLYFLYTNQKLDSNKLLFDVEVAIITAIVLFLPVYLLLTKVHRKEIQSLETKRNVAELIDHAADMILITRPNGQIINANRKACQVLGFSVEQLKSMHNTDIDIECTLYRNPKMHQQLFSGQSLTFESTYRTADNERIPIENHISIAGWMDGTHYLEIARDITRRRKVEKELYDSKEALERARNRLESRMQERNEKLVEEVHKREMTEKRIYEIRLLLENLVNSMPSVIIALDENLKVTQWNLEAEKVFGVFEGAAIGQVITQLLPQFKSVIFKMIRQSNKGTRKLYRNINIRMGEENKQFEVMVYPLSQNASSDDPGVVIRLDDITEKAHFDEMLVQTEKMLSLGGLAAGMAHEINNPLGAILQSTQNINRRLSPDFPRNQKIAEQLNLDLDKVVQYLEKQKIHSALGAIKEAGERAATIVSDMLSFARPSQGESTSINIEEALLTSIRLAKKDFTQYREHGFRDIKVEQQIEPDLPTIKAQKNQLHQVLLNLLINAAQALAAQEDNTHPTITVKAHMESVNLRIDIMDNGPGMPEKIRKRVFEPFFTTKPEGKGTGLGLSVSYFIISEQLKGQLRVESAPDLGTCFTILIPAKNEDEIKTQTEVHEEQIQLPFENI